MDIEYCTYQVPQEMELLKSIKPALLTLMQEFDRETHNFVDHGTIDYGAQLADGKKIVVTAQDESYRVLGYSILALEPRCELSEAYVIPSARRSGLWMAMTLIRINEAQSRSITTIYFLSAVKSHFLDNPLSRLGFNYESGEESMLLNF